MHQCNTPAPTQQDRQVKLTRKNPESKDAGGRGAGGVDEKNSTRNIMMRIKKNEDKN